MAKRRRTSVTPATRTRGLTSTQRTINRATGVNNSFNYNRNAARDSAETFARAFMSNPMATAADRQSMSRDMRNSRRRKSNGGKGG